MRTAEDVILSPVVTERSTEEQAAGRYTFYVDKRAGKTEIKLAVEELFGVKVLKVNTVKVPGKMKRVRYKAGKTAERKKAVVKIDMDPKSGTYLVSGGKPAQSSKKYKDSIEDFGITQ